MSSISAEEGGGGGRGECEREDGERGGEGVEWGAPPTFLTVDGVRAQADMKQVLEVVCAHAELLSLRLSHTARPLV